ncbi:MAG: hypothetical protein HZB55_07100 [Deltaproteobacteria bacterium]|nr:hypothetical protein [Deltaproteobacteria bacterium]
MMSNRQFSALLVTTAVAGFLGGAVSSRTFSAREADAAKAPAAPKSVTAQEYRLLDPSGNTQVRIGFNDDGLATVSWIYRGKDQPAQYGKEQTILIGNMWGFGQKKPQPPPPAQPKQ